MGENETAAEEEEENPIFDYSKLKAKPNEKGGNFLRRRLSVYLNSQQFGRGGVQFGQLNIPGVSRELPGRGCPVKMAQDIVNSMLAAQGID